MASSHNSPTHYHNVRGRLLDNKLLDLELFQDSEHGEHDPENDIDPDNIFYSHVNINCKYYSDNECDSFNSEGKLSIIHLNCRSKYRNFICIKEYLQQFNVPFSIVTLSEAWLNENKGTDFTRRLWFQLQK